MSANSGIEWTDHTFNPWWGCVKVSPACANCYAEAWAKRTGNQVWGRGSERRFFGDKHWHEPILWNRKAEAAGVRGRVFCASMADVFEDRSDLEEPRARLWRLVEETPSLDWLLLTKRPENVGRMVPWGGEWPVNVWLGATVENDEQWRRVTALMDTHAATRFLSCEPLLGPLCLDGVWGYPGSAEAEHLENWPIDWVIAGGESGPKARPSELEWYRNLRDQCSTAGVAFFMKQITVKGRKVPFDEWPDDLQVREFPQ